MSIEKRKTFRRIFHEGTSHASECLRVRTSAWWDGRTLLLIETALMGRIDDPCAEWNEPQVTTALHTTPFASESAAIRKAIAEHDASCAAEFEAFEGAPGEDSIQADERIAGA